MPRNSSHPPSSLCIYHHTRFAPCNSISSQSDLSSPCLQSMPSTLTLFFSFRFTFTLRPYLFLQLPFLLGFSGLLHLSRLLQVIVAGTPWFFFFTNSTFTHFIHSPHPQVTQYTMSSHHPLLLHSYVIPSGHTPRRSVSALACHASVLPKPSHSIGIDSLFSHLAIASRCPQSSQIACPPRLPSFRMCTRYCHCFLSTGFPKRL